MGGDGPYDSGAGSVAVSLFVIVAGGSLILVGIVGVLAVLMAVTVGLP